jgi:hypothetical protein
MLSRVSDIVANCVSEDLDLILDVVIFAVQCVFGHFQGRDDDDLK